MSCDLNADFDYLKHYQMSTSSIKDSFIEYSIDLA